MKVTKSQVISEQISQMETEVKPVIESRLNLRRDWIIGIYCLTFG